MTLKSKRRITKPVTKSNHQDPTLSDWLENWDLFPMKTPPSAPPFQLGEYVKTGFCGRCLMECEAIQPGGLEPRHCHNHITTLSI